MTMQNVWVVNALGATLPRTLVVTDNALAAYKTACDYTIACYGYLVEKATPSAVTLHNAGSYESAWRLIDEAHLNLLGITVTQFPVVSDA